MSQVDDEEILRSNLQVPALSPEALARIRRATEAEWRAQVGGPPRRLWIPRAAVAAGAVLALIGAWQFWMSGSAVRRTAGHTGAHRRLGQSWSCIHCGATLRSASAAI